MVSTGAEIILYAMMLILPLSALLARRVPMGQVAKMALAWAAIFAVGLVIVGQRDRLKPIWDDTAEALVGRDQRVSGAIVRIRKAADGHFWATADLNGVERRMLIDSGATSTALSAKTARAVGADVDDRGFPSVIDTANGRIVALNGTVRTLRIGGISASDLPVVVADGFGDTDVIGMNFLSRLAAWRVEGEWLILEPRQNST